MAARRASRTQPWAKVTGPRGSQAATRARGRAPRRRPDAVRRALRSPRLRLSTPSGACQRVRLAWWRPAAAARAQPRTPPHPCRTASSLRPMPGPAPAGRSGCMERRYLSATRNGSNPHPRAFPTEIDRQEKSWTALTLAPGGSDSASQGRTSSPQPLGARPACGCARPAQQRERPDRSPPGALECKSTALAEGWPAQKSM